jgi:hypothetical protein
MPMFPTPNRIVLVHLSGKVIRTNADHPCFIEGWGGAMPATFLVPRAPVKKPSCTT